MKKEGRQQEQFIVTIITLIAVAFLASAINERMGYTDISGQAVTPQKAFTSRGFDDQHTEAWTDLSKDLSNDPFEKAQNAEIKQTIGIILFEGNGAAIIKTTEGVMITTPNMLGFSVGERVSIQYRQDVVQNKINVLDMKQI